MCCKQWGLPFVYHPSLVEEIPVFTPGIYILTGGRQVGKSTTLKLMISKLLKQNKILPSQIYWLPCDTIKDFSQLLFEIEQFRQALDPEKPFMLFLDEITYVEGWTRAIKSLADAGFFNLGSVLITGSDSCPGIEQERIEADIKVQERPDWICRIRDRPI